MVVLLQRIFLPLERNGHDPSYIYSGLKGSYLEGGHRVPFLVKWPDVVVPTNSESDATICTTDFMATCAEIVNYSLKENEGEDSFSMIPLLTGLKAAMQDLPQFIIQKQVFLPFEKKIGNLYYVTEFRN